MKIYVINLDRSPDRWHRISHCLDGFDIPFERIRAIDGATVNLDEVADNEACRNYMGRNLTLGEAGCFLSHVSALKAFLSTRDEYAVVLEDDAELVEDFATRLDFIIRAVSDLPYGAVSAVNLHPSDKKYSSRFTEKNDQKLLSAHRFPMSAMGILWTRTGARRALDNALPVALPYDNLLRLLFTGTSEGFSASPPLMRQSGFKSDIKRIDASAQRKKGERRRAYFFIRNRRIMKEKLSAIVQMLRWRLFNPLKI